MAFTMTLWAVNDEKLAFLEEHKLDSEDRLETWIAQDPNVLGMDVLIIGRQVTTTFAKRIDLLAIDGEGNLVIIELKRNMTARETVAQVLDYASWVNVLPPETINNIASAYLKKPLADAFKQCFETAIPDDINTSHRMVIVASKLDDSSERIVQYLSSVHKLDINVVFFTCFQHNGSELVGRSWLMDPVEVEARREETGKGRDFTKYDVTIKGITSERLTKRASIFAVVHFLCNSGVTPEKITSLVKRKNIFRDTDGPSFDESRVFRNDEELIHSGGRTYAFTNQWGSDTIRAIDNLIEAFPEHHISCKPSSSSGD